MKHALSASIVLLLCASQAVANDKYSRDVKLSKGKAKVEFTAMSAEGTPTGPAKNPRVGIAPSPGASFAGYLARQLDESGKVTAVPSSQLGSSGTTVQSGFEQLMRSEVVASVTGMCRSAKLDYVLLMGAPQTSMKTDMGAYVFGLGRTRMRHTAESRLVDCRTGKAAWAQTVLFETSQGVLSSAFTGNAMGALLGGPEAEAAMAKVFAEKLTADMGW